MKGRRKVISPQDVGAPRESATTGIAAPILPQRRSVDLYRSLASLDYNAGESVRRYLDRLDQLFVDLAQYQAARLPSAEEAARLLVHQRAELNAHLRHAIAPIVDLSSWIDTLHREYQQLHSGLATMAAFNQALGQATLLWASRLPPQRADADSPQPDESTARPSSQIIEVIPADARTRLKSVDFLPLRVLDRIYQAPKALYKLSPRQFEELIAEIVSELGFTDVELTPGSRDKGRDVVATKRVNGIPLLFAFECKQQAPNRKVGLGVVRSLLGTVTHAVSRANVGVLVTTSTFTRGAQEFFLTETAVKGRDFDGVIDWLDEIRRLRRDA